MKILYLLVFAFLFCHDECYAGCYHRQNVNHSGVTNQVIPLPVIQPQPLVVYAPFVVQYERLVPVVENRVIYRPVTYYYNNTLHYYPVVPTYGYQYYADPWQGYNY